MKCSFATICGLGLVTFIVGCNSAQPTTSSAKLESTAPAPAPVEAPVEPVSTPVEPQPAEPAPVTPATATASATVPEDKLKVDEPAPPTTEPSPAKPEDKPLPANVTVIDLGPYQQQVRELIAKSVAGFTEKHPDTEVSMLVLSYSGLNPTTMVALDTQAHSDAHVTKHPVYCGSDEHGRFCSSPYDCAFALREMSFAGFPDLYEVKEIALKLPNGTVMPIDREREGDEAINAVMFQFLVPIVEQSTDYRSLKRAPLFRTGVRMQSSRFAKFWVPTK